MKLRVGDSAKRNELCSGRYGSFMARKEVKVSLCLTKYHAMKT